VDAGLEVGEEIGLGRVDGVVTGEAVGETVEVGLGVGGVWVGGVGVIGGGLLQNVTKHTAASEKGITRNKLFCLSIFLFFSLESIESMGLLGSTGSLGFTV